LFKIKLSIYLSMAFSQDSILYLFFLHLQGYFWTTLKTAVNALMVLFSLSPVKRPNKLGCFSLHAFSAWSDIFGWGQNLASEGITWKVLQFGRLRPCQEMLDQAAKTCQGQAKRFWLLCQRRWKKGLGTTKSDLLKGKIKYPLPPH